MTHRDGFPRLSARSAWRGVAGHRKPCETPSESLGKPPFRSSATRSTDNSLGGSSLHWGSAPSGRTVRFGCAPRIHGGLLKLGFIVSEATVSHYLRRLARPRSQRWAIFIRNHLLLGSAGVDPGPEYRQHLGGGHLDQIAPVPASECRSPEQGQPMRPVFRLPEPRMCDA